MATLTAADRDKMPAKEFGQPDKKGFPMQDATHQRMAISGATRSDHKAAISKMHPEHVHKLVQDAHAGKFGPEAQSTAKMAMQSPAGAPGEQSTDQPGPTAKPNYAQMFSGGGQADDDPDQAVPAGQMFGGR